MTAICLYDPAHNLLHTDTIRSGKDYIRTPSGKKVLTNFYILFIIDKHCS